MAADNSPVGVQNLKSAIEIGQQVLKSLELVNGGAVVAILAFYGNLLKDGGRSPIDPIRLGSAIEAFALGLTVAIGAAGLAYLGQLSVATNVPDDGIEDPAERRSYTQRANRSSVRFLRSAVLAALISLALFGRGVWCSARALGTVAVACQTAKAR